jgi:hypothetical protein
MKKNIIGTILAMSSPPPPPPISKRSRKPLIAVIVVVLIVVLAVGVYLAMGGFGTNNSVTPTPTPIPGTTSTPGPSSSATAGPTATSTGTGVNVAEATSLQFTISMTNSSGASLGSYTYSAKNAGTSNMMIRVEFADPSSGSSYVYIVNGAQQKAWMEVDGQWTDLSSAFTSEFSSWDETFTGYKDSLADWSGLGDWTYTSPTGETVRIHDISVNPSLPDSLFEHT